MVSLNKINKQLNNQIRNCRKCGLWQGRKNSVPGEGNLKAMIMLVGQNPGAEEDQQGKPFVGRAGKYLDRILKKNKILRKDIFITSVVKCRTPKNRKPTKKEIETCMPYLIEQIEMIRPKSVVLMGEVAWKIFGNIKNKKIKYIKTYHPAAAMRFPKIRKKFERDFKKLNKNGKNK